MWAQPMDASLVVSMGLSHLVVLRVGKSEYLMVVWTGYKWAVERVFFVVANLVAEWEVQVDCKMVVLTEIDHLVVSMAYSSVDW